MALQTKSAVFAIKEESTEGSLIQPDLGSQFTVLRDGFSFSSSVESLSSDELVNDIGASKSFLAKETPSASIPKYFKHSGVEGQEPDYGLLIKSAMGASSVNATEYNTIVGSTAGTSSARGIVKVDSGEGVNFSKGEALLIKDGANSYSIRNVESVSTDDLNLNFNLSNAPGTGVDLGKAIHYSPSAVGHPTFSAHLYQSGTSSAYHQAISGCRTTGMSIDFPANELSSISFDFEGIKFFLNPVEITSTTKYIDFVDDGGAKTAILDEQVYKTPIELCRAVETKMGAASIDVITCSYDNSTGKFTIASDGTTFELSWNTGTNTANSAAAKLGFSAAGDDTGSTSYVSDNAQNYDPPVSPAFDSNDPSIVRSNELMLGDYFRNVCRKGSNVSVSVSTPKTDVDDFCSESGVSESVINEREVTFSATLLLEQHDIELFDKFINNTTTSIMFNHGPKSGGNWVAGKCVNVYIPNASITSNVIEDSDGFQVVQVEATGFVSADQKDIHINFI